MTTLQQELDDFLAGLIQQVPSQILETSSSELQKIYSTQLPTGLQVGDPAPDFALSDALGKTVQLKELLEKGPVVLSFYRGEWCPFCNLELRALQQALPQLQRYNAQLVAISPQTADHSLSLQEKHNLQFPVLSDPTGQTLRDYRLLYEFTSELKELYQTTFQVDLSAFNGNLGWKLPVPATYVVNRNGMIQAAATNMDYTKRMNVEDILIALNTL